MVRTECSNKLVMADTYADVDNIMKKLDRLKEYKGLFESLDVQQANKYHKYTIRDHIIYTVLGVEKDFELRWAALLHDIGKRDVMTIDSHGRGHFIGHQIISRRMSEGILKELKRELKFSNEVYYEILNLIELHDSLNYTQTKSIKYSRLRQFISINGIETTYKILKLKRADTDAQSELSIGLKKQLEGILLEKVVQIEKEGTAFREQDLCINRQDLRKLGIRKKDLDTIIHILLKNVWGEPKNNSYDTLITIAKHYNKIVRNVK